jgi:PAS domain S-box-containing protein
MTVSSRLALAMVLLVVLTSCLVSAFACYFLAEAYSRAVLTAILSAALAGGAVAAGVAIILAVGLAKGLSKPSPDVSGTAKVADAGNEPGHDRAYQALIDNERMARAIIEGALDAFVQTDERCVILNWSPHAEALMGWTRAEAVGRSVEDLVFPEPQRPVHRQWVDRFLSEAEGDAVGGRYETPLLHRDGREFFAEVSLTALRRGEGHIINAFVRDITAKRAAEEQLFQAQKMESVGQLTGGIAHDFNNMLTVITGTIEILADGVKHDPALASIARMINDAAERASQLTANLLAFARRQPLRPLETDVNALIEEVVKLLEPTLGRQI